MLPILISIPHGGTQVPKELCDRVCITPDDLFDDGDACTQDIYDLDGDVVSVVKTDIARAFVDVNRAPDDRPPRNTDGVVKTATSLNRPIYGPGNAPDGALTELLLERYHTPYHAALAKAASDPGIEIGLDCHSMLSHAPPIGTDHGTPRPLFCLSNRDGATAPTAVLEKLADAIRLAFDIPRSDVGLNDPFRGGYITQRHGGHPLPWIQVEMNRSWYLDAPWFDRDTLHVDPARLTELRSGFLNALGLLEL
jgi:formiminoglutamase